MLRTALKDLELLFLFMPFVTAVVTVSRFPSWQPPGTAPWGNSAFSSGQCVGMMGHSVWPPRPESVTGGKPWFGLEPSLWFCLSVRSTGTAGRAKTGNLNFIISMARSLSGLCALHASRPPLQALGGRVRKKRKKTLRMCKDCSATAKTLLCFHAGLVTNQAQHQAHQQGAELTPSLPDSVG